MSEMFGFLFWANLYDDPMALLDEDGVLISTNDAMRRLLEASSDEEAPEIFDLMHGKASRALLSDWDCKVNIKREVLQVLARSLLHDGALMRWRIAPLKEREGALVTMSSPRGDADWVVLGEESSQGQGEEGDVVENGRSGDELRRLFSRIIHDLKAPSRRIRTFAQLIAREDVVSSNPKVEKFIDSIITNAERNTHLVDVLRAYFALFDQEAGEQVTLVVDDLVTSAIQEAGLERETVRISGDGDVTLYIEPGVAIKALAELLTNSALHGINEQGEVSITVEIERAPDSLRLIVQDEGPGIHEGLEDRLFEPMSTGLSARAVRQASEERFGFGLATVAHRMARLGGSVHHEQRDPVGATFVLSFPLASKA